MSAQALDALLAANAARMGAARVKGALRQGTITLREAIDHPDAGPIAVAALLACQRRWGASRAERLCAGVPVRPNKRVRDLTDRQRAEIVRLAGEGR
jgi:hypothetical protein